MFRNHRLPRGVAGLIALIPPVMNRPVQFSYRVTVLATQVTTPKFTFAASYPPAYVNWGDGSALEAVTSNVELNHAYGTGGTYTVRLVMARQAKWLTGIELNDDKVSGGVTSIQKFPKLLLFYGFSNAAWIQDVTSWVLPTPLIYFEVQATGITGNISAWVLPAALTTFLISATALSGVITNWALPAALVDFEVSFTSVSGSMSGWTIPAGMTIFFVFSTALTGVPVLSSMDSIMQIRANNCSLPQASVDLWLSRCVAREGSTTWATPVLTLDGTNVAPSAQGVTDKNTLVAAGWTVTWTA